MRRLLTTLALAGLSGMGCGSDNPAPTTAVSQVPPMGHEALQAWLKTGDYKKWHCEPAAHEARSPSPHGSNRICSNDKVSAQGTGEYPAGAASVKELFTSSGAIGGYAVDLHTAAGATGDTWYWYEVVPADSAVPHAANGVVADGMGGDGPAKSICVGCHVATGLDAAHSGHDFVYTQVK